MQTPTAAKQEHFLVVPSATAGRDGGVFRRLAALLAALSLTGSALALNAGPDQRWIARHYQSLDGLPVSSVLATATDAQGFLWLATHDGLARFDGRNFTVFDTAGWPVLGGNRFRSVHVDDQRRVYALGAAGQWLQVGGGSFTLIGSDPDFKVREVQWSPQRCVTTDSGLHCLDVERGTWRLRRAFAPDAEVLLALAAGDVDWLVRANAGVQRCSAAECQTVWPGPIRASNSRLIHLLTPDDMLVALHSQLLRVPKTPSAATTADWVRKADGKPLRDVLQLTDDATLGVVAGTADGLYRINGNRAQRLPDLPRGGQNAHTLAWRAGDGALWRSAGGTLYRDGERVLETQGTISHLHFADDGSVFVSTMRAGFYVLNRPRVELLDAAAVPGLAGNLYGLAQDHAGAIWIGSLDDELQRWMPDGTLHRYGHAQGLPGPNTWVVHADRPQQRVWAASYQPGLWAYSATDDRFEPVPLPNALRTAQWRSLSTDAAGQLWAAGSHGVWQQQDGQWLQRWPTATAEPTLVLAVVHAEDGTAWVGGERGLWRLPPGAPAEPVAPKLLGRTPVRGLHLANDGSLWACTEGLGLLRIAAADPAGVQARLFGRAEGLPSNSPHAVLEDPTGALWVNSNQGIFRVTPEGLSDLLDGRTQLLSPLSLGLTDGLTELEGNGGVQPAALIDSAGRFWFPSQRGIVRFDPARLQLKRSPPQPVIDGLEPAGQWEHANTIRLPPGERSVRLRYDAADLPGGAPIRFRYRLSPIEAQWTEAGDRRLAVYGALTPGQYRFEVIAGNGDGFWSTVPTIQTFEVPPHWHETLSARLGFALAALLATACVLFGRWQRLHRRASRLELEVQRRTQELQTEKRRVESTLAELAGAHGQLEQRNLRLAAQASRLEALDRFRTRLLADVSHELRTPLMLIKLPLAELVGDTALSPRERARIALPLQQTERLSELVEQLVQLVRVEAGKLRLVWRRIDLARWATTLLDGFAPLAKRSGVQLRLDFSDTLPPLYADPVQLSTVLGNLLDNALKYTPSGSTVRVCGSVINESTVRMSVCDQGPGFDPAVAGKLFERFFRAEGPPRSGREGLGIGLALARELIELHGGRIGAESSAHGAEFWFELPLGNAHVALDDLALDGDVTAAAFPTTELLPVQGSDGDQLLLVEDHPELAAYLGERLAEHYPVQVVGSAEAAWETLSSGRIRLLVSDVVLPGMDGVALCARLKSDADPLRAAMPVVLISAKSGADDRERGIAAGAHAWLAKPFGLGELLEVLAVLWPLPAARLLLSTPEDVEATQAVLGDGITHTPTDALLELAVPHLSNPAFGVAEWSACAHLSERQLRRRVSELTGQAPVVWLREQRLQRVRQMVASGRSRTLAHAGYACGFDKPRYLYRLYRARYGDT